MSRRCRASLIQGAGGAGGDLSSGCSCGRLGSPAVPCTEPVIYGQNILRDPGFDLTPAEIGLNPGPFGEQFPGDNGMASNGASQLRWADNSFYAGDLPYWAVESNDGINAALDNRWHISTDDPHLGVYHGRIVFDDDFGAGYVTDNAALYPCGFFLCAPPSKRPVTAIVAPGDLVTQGVFAKADNIIDDPQIQLAFQTASANFDTSNQWPSFAWPIDDHSIGTTYQAYSWSAFMPADAHYLQAEYWAWLGAPGPTVRTIIDFDNMLLGVLPAGQGILLCVESGLVTVDNDTTETTFATCDIPANAFETRQIKAEIHGDYFNNKGTAGDITFRFKLTDSVDTEEIVGVITVPDDGARHNYLATLTVTATGTDTQTVFLSILNDAENRHTANSWTKLQAEQLSLEVTAQLDAADPDFEVQMFSSSVEAI